MVWMKTIAVRLLPALAALLLLPPLVGRAPRALPGPILGDVPNKPYRDAVHKYSLLIFPDWAQVPVEVGEKYEVAKFYDPANKGDAFRPELTIFRLDKKNNGNPGPVTGVDPKKLPKIIEALDRFAPKSVFDLAFGNLISFEDKDGKIEKSAKKASSKDKVDGRLWVVELHPIQETGKPSPDHTLVAMLAAFEKDGVEYGIRLVCTGRRRDDYEAAIKQISKSFLFFDDRAKEIETLAVLDGINLTPRRRGEIEKGLIKGWGVEISPKKNYVIIYNTKGNKNRELAKVLAERIERIREQVYEKQFPPAQPLTSVSIMRICGDVGEYHAYGGSPGTAGYWNSHSEELVFYDASPAKKVDDDTLSVLYHEAFHQYIFYSVGNVAPHSWFNEGHGDYYAGAKYAAGKFKIEPFDWRVATVKQAIREGPRAFSVQKDPKTGTEQRKYSNDKGYTPLKDLVKFTQGEYYSYPGVSYAQGWSLIYFLREGLAKKKEWKEKWGNILPTYFDVLKREVTKEGKLKRGGDEPKGPTGPDTPKDPPSDPKDPPKDPKAPDDPPEPKDPKDPDPGTGADEPPADPGFQPIQEGEASESALEAALREAFKGVDMDELEKAWIEFTQKVSG